jgi:hypothetical protein
MSAIVRQSADAFWEIVPVPVVFEKLIVNEDEAAAQSSRMVVEPAAVPFAWK